MMIEWFVQMILIRMPISCVVYLFCMLAFSSLFLLSFSFFYLQRPSQKITWFFFSCWEMRFFRCRLNVCVCLLYSVSDDKTMRCVPCASMISSFPPQNDRINEGNGTANWNTVGINQHIMNEKKLPDLAAFIIVIWANALTNYPATEHKGEHNSYTIDLFGCNRINDNISIELINWTFNPVQFKRQQTKAGKLQFIMITSLYCFFSVSIAANLGW